MLRSLLLSSKTADLSSFISTVRKCRLRVDRGAATRGAAGGSSRSFETIAVEQRGNVQLIKLNRPEKRNALSSLCCSELLHSLKTADGNADIHVNVLTGNGDIFCAGADIAEMSTWTEEYAKSERVFHDWTNVNELQKPTIAAVNGPATGGGCELAMLCDIIIAADTAFFSQPETNVGLIPGMGGTQRLVRAVGKSKAMEMILTGDLRGLSAEEAAQYGLVSRVVSKDALMEEAMKMAQRIAERSNPVIIKAKKCVNAAYEKGLKECLDMELQEFWSCFGLNDSHEGLTAFLQKRTPKFQHK